MKTMRTLSCGWLMVVILLGVAEDRALGEDGHIFGWGNNNYGQCQMPAPNEGFVAVAGGGGDVNGFTLGLRADGSIVTCGYNSHGQCNVPTPNTNYMGIAAGGATSLAVRRDGSVVLWGYNGYGMWNLPSPNAGFIAVATSGMHCLALRGNGSIAAWGDNTWGQCNVPSPNAGFIAVAAGGAHSLGLQANGVVIAWGANNHGQCIVPAPNNGFTAISANVYHSLGLRADGSISAWGGNPDGQCNVPLPNTDFVGLAAGCRHSLGMKSSGSIVGWGSNGYGQCDVPSPNSGFVRVASGRWHGLGLKRSDAPYEIVAATFDDSLYQNGVDTAHVTVVTRSRWGSSPSLMSQASAKSNLGDQFDLGADVFALAPSGEHTSQFSWPMPAADHPWEFDLCAVVSDQNGSFVVSDTINGACSGMVISQAELETFESELAESQCLPPGSACDYAMAGAIPHMGAPMGIVAFVDAGCQMGERLRAGNYLGAGVAAIGGLIGGISLVLDFLPGSEPVDAIAGAVSAGVTCADDLWLSDLYPAGGVDFRSGSEIDSLAAQVRAVFPIVGRVFSAEVFLKGSAMLRVGIDSSWTSLDTLGLTETAVFGIRDSLQWGHVGSGPRSIGGAGENPHSAFDVELRVTARDTLEFGFLHRNKVGEVTWIRYGWIVVDSGAVASVSLADTVIAFPLYLDRDGDGTIDATILPGGVSSAESQTKPGGVERNRITLRCLPNPSGGDVTIALQSGSTHRGVRVAIYDVAGREVRGVDVGDLHPGVRQLVWDRRDDEGRPVASGIYHCVAGFDRGGRTAKRLVVLR